MICLALDIADRYDLVIVLRWDYTEAPNQIQTLVDLPRGIAHEVLNSPLLKDSLRSAEQVEYIAWYLESAVPYLEYLANTLWSQNPGCHLILSFQPDAFLSAYYLKDTLEKFTNALSGGSWSFGPAYLFFAVNEMSRRNVSWTQLQVVSLDAYLRALAIFGSNKLQTTAQKLRDRLSIEQIKHVVFVAIRPWCTSFHGGNYDFGSGADTLFHIYDTIIRELEAEVAGQTLFVIRGDCRHEETQRAVITRLSRRLGPQLYDLTDEIPPGTTLELFIYSLFGLIDLDSGPKVSLTMVSLDSSVPFPVAAIGLPFRFFMGAPNAVLAEAGASESQLRYIKNMTMRTLMFLQYIAPAMPHLELHHNCKDGLVTAAFTRVADA